MALNWKSIITTTGASPMTISTGVRDTYGVLVAIEEGSNEPFRQYDYCWPEEQDDNFKVRWRRRTAPNWDEIYVTHNLATGLAMRILVCYDAP